MNMSLSWNDIKTRASAFEGTKERGYIDLIRKGKIIIEMKTPGKDLNKAYDQVKAYALNLPNQKEIPKGILTSDFLSFQYYDLEDGEKEMRYIYA